MRWFALCLLLLGGAARAGGSVAVCYNYGCQAQGEVRYSAAQLQGVGDLLGGARDALQERALLGLAVGWLLGWAGEQTPIAADRGGNYADAGRYGRMDCIDHATTTTRLLRLIEREGGLRFHRVLDPVRRSRLLIFEHHAAQIEENGPAGGGRYVVDSWFFDNGQPAAILPLDNWLAGDGPDIGIEYD